MLHAIIMAGGSGTRFWPKSRRDRPKQLLKLFGDATMLQQTVARIEPLVPRERVVIVTGADQAEATRAQLPELPPENIVAEPCPRDTAACVGLAAWIVRKKDPDGTMIVMPADHVIEPAAVFLATVRAAVVGHRGRSHGPGHLRNQADPARDRLWLHRARRAAGDPRGNRREPRRPVPREARPRHRRELPRRRQLRLELGDLPLESPDHPGRAGAAPAPARRRARPGRRCARHACGTRRDRPRISPHGARSRSTRP